jgi:mandelamide amidase
MTARALARRVRDGAAHPRDLMAASLARAAEHADLNAFVGLDPDAALAGAEAAGGGALAGVPFVVKDCIATRDHPLTGGTPALAAHRPGVDAGAVARLRAAGATVLGTTNLHELCFGITGNNAHTGPTRNPSDRSRVAGGSSSGTAAAVAAGVVAFGLAADTGGSARIPASFCGVVGFRPTTGRYPADGLLALSTTRDTVGVIGATVDDVAVVDEVLAGEVPPPRPGPGGVAGLRLGVPRALAEPADPEVEAVVGAALARLEAAGAEVVALELHELVELDERAGLPIVLYETEHIWRRLARELLDTTLEDLAGTIASEDVRDVFSLVVSEDRVPPAAYREAMTVVRPALQDAYRRALAGVDALVFPTVPVLAPLIGEDRTTRMGDATVPTFATCIRNTSPASVAGVPSLSLPAGRSRSGLPVGLSLEGAAGADAALLGLSAAVEAVLAEGAA